MADKILLVDDEAGIRKVLGISLADMGYHVFTAENGREALDIFKQERPALVLTDIKMPVMDGVDLLQHIKRENVDTEVIMITGHGDMDLAIKCLKLEATDFITKPINDDALEIALKRAHDRIHMREQLREYTENLEQLVQEKSARLVEAERLAALGQALDSMSTALKDMAGDFPGGVRFLNEMPCFVAIHNRDLEVVASNQLYREQLGEFADRRSWELYGDEVDVRDTCPAARTFTSGQGQRVKSTIRYKDGRQYPVMVHTAPIRNSRGDLELVLEISGDISEIQRLQQALQTSQQRYRQLFDAVPCYISVQDREFRLTATNSRFTEHFGEHLSSHCYKIYKQRKSPCDNCPVARTFADGRSHQAEMTVTNRLGDEIHLLIWTAPLVNAEGKIVQVMEMATDITQVRQLQDNLMSLGLMVSSISHGIKGVLTGLDAGLFFLESGLKKDDAGQTQEGLEVVKLMTERIRNVVLDILYFAKERDLNWDQVDVAAFARDLAFPIETKIKDVNIHLECDFSAPLGHIEADADVVRTALTSILENAVEACREDRSRERHTIVFRVSGTETHVEFQVIDDGLGMDAETREKIFSLFFSSKGSRGTGLGLFIARKIIRQHGGEIEFESAPAKGSRFTITLPRKLPEDAKLSKSASQQPPRICS
jgi:PAS domain S-box-containing protein